MSGASSADAVLQQLVAISRPLGEALLILDRDGIVRAAGGACREVFGWAAASLTGRPWSMLHADPFPEDYFRSGAEHPPLAVRFRRRDGRVFRGQLRDAAVDLPLAGFRGFAAAVRDLTDELQAARERDEAERRGTMRDLARRVSHRLNNDLGTIIAHIEMARLEGVGRESDASLRKALAGVSTCRDNLARALRSIPEYGESQHSSDIFRHPEGADAGPPRSARVLVVEDETTIRDMVARLLERDGHVVEVATSAREALVTAVGGSFDLILTDSASEGRSPIDFVKLLRAAQPRARVAVMSGRVYSGAEKAGLKEVGVHAFLAKPFQVEELRRVVATLL